MIYVQSGILIALHCIGNAHGLHQRIPHGVQHLLQLFPTLSQHRFIELSALLHGNKQRAHIHAGDSGLIAVVILLRALERFQLHAHGCANVLNAHLFHLLGSLAVLLLGLQHLAEAVLTHHGHLVIHQHRHQQIAVQLLPLFLGDRVLLPVLIAGLLIDLLPLLLFCFRHKNLHGVIFLRSDLLRQDMFHTLVLNAHINDVRCVLRQRHLCQLFLCRRMEPPEQLHQLFCLFLSKPPLNPRMEFLQQLPRLRYRRFAGFCQYDIRIPPIRPANLTPHIAVVFQAAQGAGNRRLRHMHLLRHHGHRAALRMFLLQAGDGAHRHVVLPCQGQQGEQIQASKLIDQLEKGIRFTVQSKHLAFR